jgi:hypothetical protein
VIVEHIKNDSPNLIVYLQKLGLKKKAKQIEEQKLSSKVHLQKVKVEQIEEQKVGSKLYLQKVKVEHVKEGPTSYIQVETIDQIYDQKFHKYLDYCWIQKSII